MIEREKKAIEKKEMMSSSEIDNINGIGQHSVQQS